MEIFATVSVVAVLLAALAGIAIGVLSGLLGIGGGTVMVPIFRLGFGLDALQATATSLFSIVFISISGCITHIRNKTCIVPVGVGAGLAGAVASPFGVYLASISPAWAIMLAAGIVIAYSGYTMLKKARKLPSKKKLEQMRQEKAAGKSAQSQSAAAAGASGQAGEKAAAASKKSTVTVKENVVDETSFRRDRLWMCIPIGLLAGVCSGYIGVGGGFIMVPLFLAFLDVPMRYASGTSLLAILILAIPGAGTQVAMGNVDLLISFATILGAIPGAVLGANLAKKVPERELRYLFAIMLMVCAVTLVIQEFAII